MSGKGRWCPPRQFHGVEENDCRMTQRDGGFAFVETGDLLVLADALRVRLAVQQRSVVGIDGNAGVGKTHLAAALAKEIPATVVSVDDHVIPNRGAYAESVRLPELKAAVNEAPHHVFVEGVCLLKVLELAEIEHTTLIYVKELTSSGRWDDEEICDPHVGADELIHQLEEQIKPFATTPEESTLHPLTEEVIRYHAEYRPLGLSELVFSIQVPDVPAS